MWKAPRKIPATTKEHRLNDVAAAAIELDTDDLCRIEGALARTQAHRYRHPADLAARPGKRYHPGGFAAEAVRSVRSTASGASERRVRRAADGALIGMFIARAVARAHGCSISAQSAGDRTTFEVTLPREALPVETRALATT